MCIKSPLINYFKIFSLFRYLFSLQIKRDLAQGVLICNDNTAALMASYIVQGNHIYFLNKYIINNKFYRL